VRYLSLAEALLVAEAVTGLDLATLARSPRIDLLVALGAGRSRTVAFAHFGSGVFMVLWNRLRSTATSCDAFVGWNVGFSEQLGFP
jgi:hypothetical protein